MRLDCCIDLRLPEKMKANVIYKPDESFVDMGEERTEPEIVGNREH